MCGVCGVVDFSAPVDPVRVQWMCDFLAHRGPDDSGIWADPACVLGSRRLAIVDVADGRQPAANEDGTVQVVFNGEIYNHRQIRRWLARRGHQFRSGSDVEVIPHLYEERGLDFVDELDGDFAIGLWDAKVRRLVLTRDRVGVKPLFYHVDGERLIFASEIKGVFASGLCPITMDPQGLSDCFFYSHTVGPSTFWMGVRDLSPGTVLCFDTRGLTIQRYFNPLERPDETIGLQRGRAAVESFSHVFTQAVQKRIPDEVKAGISLSGGLDSTTIAAVCARLCGAPLSTSSIRLVGEKLDETLYSRHVARELALENEEIEITGQRACELLPVSLWHFESPFWFGAVASPFLEMTRVARAQGYKVAMSGDGSDELLAGYDFYRLMVLNQTLTAWKLGWVQPTIWRNAVRWLGVPNGIDHHILSVNAKLDDHRRHYGEVPAWIYLWEAIGAIARPLLDGSSLPPPTQLPPPPRHDSLRQQLHFEFCTRLPNWILPISDRLGMANSIEVRVPYLDRDMIDLCRDLAPDMIMRRGVEKYILRQAFREVVPRKVSHRRKRPFMTPIAPWYLDGPGREMATSYLSRAAVRKVGLFDPPAVEQLWRRATEDAGTWQGTVSGWVSLMVLSTHIVLEQFETRRFLTNSLG